MKDDSNTETGASQATPPAEEMERGALAHGKGGKPADAGNPAAEDAEGPLTAEVVDELRKKAAERDALLNELLRSRADLDNLQKRLRRERPAWEDQAVRRFVRDLLPVIDNFERALETMNSAESKGNSAESKGSSAESKGSSAESKGESAGSRSGGPAKVVDGIRLIQQMLRRVLNDHGIEEIQAMGRQFDPELDEAMAQEEVPDHATGEIIEVLEKGYRHRDVVIRPSKVKVAVNPEESGSKAEAREPTE